MGDELEALSAPNPFQEGVTIEACPKCREMTLVECCDEPGCNQQASCGFPSPGGYRRTCGNHYKP